MTHVLILGGTGQARRLADALAPDHRVTTSLAGRTADPIDLTGAVRKGGFGGPAGLAQFLEAEDVAALIDATHPYAARMAANAAAAAHRTGTPILRLDRPPWAAREGDRWIAFGTVSVLVESLPTLGRHALVTLGGADLSAFSAASAVRLTVRAIDPPDALPEHPAIKVVLGRGPFDLASEVALLSGRGIDVLVSRNAGGDATYAKIEAARQLGLSVAMLERPKRPDMERVTTVPAAIAWLSDKIK